MGKQQSGIKQLLEREEAVATATTIHNRYLQGAKLQSVRKIRWYVMTHICNIV